MKKDKINLTILVIIALLSIALLLGNEYIFGSTLDWRTQHYAIPEYFRTLFYSDFNLFPSFAFNLGAGQNIYNFSYYGLLSPVMLVSYLLPFVKMSTYIQITSVILYLSSIVLFYKWIRTRFNESDSFFISLLFMFATPLLFHSHRHIMFVSYMPFLIMSFMGVDKFYKGKKSMLLIISTFLLIMTNYFFAVSSIFAIGIYAIYTNIEREKKLKEIINKTLKIIAPVIIAVIMSAIILLPTAYTLFSGRAETNVLIDMKRLLNPYIHGMYMLYTPYSSGLTSLIILTIVAAFFKKEKETKFLTYIFVLLLLFPIFIYILNGGMYLNAKVLIPFLPLAMLLIGKSINNLFKNRIQTVKIALIYAVAMIPTIVSVIDVYEKYVYFDVVVMSSLLILLIALKTEHIFKFGVVMLSFGIFLNINMSDSLVKRKDIEKLNNFDQQIKEYNLKDENLYRFGDYINVFDGLNRINNIEQYKTTMYSSVSNGNYNNFFYKVFTNEASYRNSAITAQGRNIMFNTYMGVKYIVSNTDLALYEKIDDKLYRNNNVLPLGYVRNKLMSKSEFEKLKFPYTNEALINYTIIDQELKDTFKSNIKALTPKYTIEKEANITVERTDKLKIEAGKNASIVLKLDEKLTNKILFIKFKMDFNESCNNGDNVITINGVANNLTCSSWKYHNRNYEFEYVISENDDIEQIKINFAKGNYELSNLEFYTLDESHMLKVRENVSEFIFDQEKTKGDKIVGSINALESGYFTMKVPYDKGFKILLNNQEVEYEMVDKAFIGFKIDKGNYKLEIEYTSPYLNLAKIVSLSGVVGLILYTYIEKRRYKDEKNIISNTLL